jgi:type I restriction enzyme S subunit
MSDTEMQDTAIGPLPTDWSVVKLRTVSSEGTERNRTLDFGRGHVLGVDNQTGLGPSDRLLGGDFSRYKLVRNNQFAYNPMRLNVGSIGLWRKDQTGIVSPDYIVFGCDEDRLDPDFLDLFRDSAGWEMQIRQSGQGSVRIRYYYRHIAEFYVPLPSLEEQQAIAHILRTLQHAKEATAQVVAAARQLKQSLMRHLFTYGPVPFDQADRVALKETEAGPVPEHWNVGPLGKFIQLQRGFDLPAQKRLPGSVPIVSSSGISGVHCESKVKGPGVVTGRYGTLGEVHYIEQDYWPLNTTLFVKDFGSNHPRFVSFFLKTLNIASFNDKTSVPGINRNHVHAINVGVPNLNEQHQIADILDLLGKKLLTEEDKGNALGALFQTLLYNLMTGKVRVKERKLANIANSLQRSG